MENKRELRIKRESFRNGFSAKLSEELARLDDDYMDERLANVCWTLFEDIHHLKWDQFREFIKAVRKAIEEAEETVSMEEIEELEKLLKKYK